MSCFGSFLLRRARASSEQGSETAGFGSFYFCTSFWTKFCASACSQHCLWYYYQ